ncbi:MAG TPA: hypothetical protein ENN40_03050 [Candidatus Aminicenantes bacterium]|nr:hypothetical protein [Candidatus Aminicenantes bacterium]
MGNVEKNTGNDGLIELESLLEKDLRDSQLAVKGLDITRDQVRRTLVRLGVSLLLLLLLFWLNIFENITTVLIAIALIVLLEGVLLFVGRSGNKSHGRGD